MDSIEVLSRTQKIIVHSPQTIQVSSEAQSILVEAPQAISVVNAGPPGPPGAIGLSRYLFHDQTTPTAAITLTHGLGMRPVVQVLIGEEEVETDIEHIDVNNVSFVFPSPTSFKAIFTA